MRCPTARPRRLQRTTTGGGSAATRTCRVAIALTEIGRDKLASEVLLHQARIGDPGDYDALSRLARDLGLPSTQLYMANNAPSGGAADRPRLIPAPKWEPANGWHVDPALALRTRCRN